MIIKKIYHKFLRKMCLTGLYLKTQKLEIYRQVDTHAVCVDTVRRIIKDRSTHMQHVSTQFEDLSKINRHTSSVCRHIQQKYLKEVDSLERCVNIVFNVQTYQVDAEK